MGWETGISTGAPDTKVTQFPREVPAWHAGFQRKELRFPAAPAHLPRGQGRAQWALEGNLVEGRTSQQRTCGVLRAWCGEGSDCPSPPPIGGKLAEGHTSALRPLGAEWRDAEGGGRRVDQQLLPARKGRTEGTLNLILKPVLASLQRR